MTPRQQEARTLRDQGLTQADIGAVMGIKQGRVSNLLDLNRKVYEGIARYRQTAKGKATANAYSKKWQRENPEKVREMHRRYYRENREKVDAARAAWKKEHPDKVREIERNGYQRNREKRLAKSAAYQRTERGRETNRRSSLKWWRKNRGRTKDESET